MEDAYQQQLSEETDAMREEYERELEKLKEAKLNHVEIDELSRENARLNEELEKFKGKYFDSEQKKIELNDAVDDIREEKFKMEAKLEEMANKISNGNGSDREEKSESEWRDLVQKLREEKESQE